MKKSGYRDRAEMWRDVVATLTIVCSVWVTAYLVSGDVTTACFWAIGYTLLALAGMFFTA